jgi:hypothetical protein
MNLIDLIGANYYGDATCLNVPPLHSHGLLLMETRRLGFARRTGLKARWVCLSIGLKAYEPPSICV